MKTYATSTSYYPQDGGRQITMPAGCTAVLYVFDDREQAVELSQNGQVFELDLIEKNAVQLNVARDTGDVTCRSWERRPIDDLADRS